MRHYDNEEKPIKIIIDLDRAKRYDFSHPNYDEFAKRCIVPDQMFYQNTKVFKSVCELKLFYMDMLMEKNNLTKKTIEVNGKKYIEA